MRVGAWNGHPLRALKHCQERLAGWHNTGLEVAVEGIASGAGLADVVLDAPPLSVPAADALAIPEGGPPGAGSQFGVRRGKRTGSVEAVGRGLAVIAVMRDLLANPESGVELGIEGAGLAVAREYVEDGLGLPAVDAGRAVEEGIFEGAVGDVVVLDAALVVFLDKVVDGLVAEYPVGRVDVALEDSGAQHDARVALGVDGPLNAVDQSILLLDVAVDHLQLRAGRNARSQGFYLCDLQLGGRDLIQQVDLLLVGKLLAGVLREVEGRNQGVAQRKDGLPLGNDGVLEQADLVRDLAGSLDLVVEVGDVADEAGDLVFETELLRLEGLKFGLYGGVLPADTLKVQAVGSQAQQQQDHDHPQLPHSNRLIKIIRTIKQPAPNPPPSIQLFFAANDHTLSSRLL